MHKQHQETALVLVHTFKQMLRICEVQAHFASCKQKNRQKSKIVAERETGALTGAFAHLAAKTAINSAIAFRVAQAQFGGIGANVAYHLLTPFQVFYPHLYIIPHLSVNFKNILCFFAKTFSPFEFL